jgi:hypothetical protein
VVGGTWLVAVAALGRPGLGQEAPAPVGEAPIARALEAMGPDGREYDTHVVTLANPFFGGRAPGTRGNELAAEYIEFQFRALGLTPLFHERGVTPDGAEFVSPRGSYRQTVDGLGRTLGPASEQRLTVEVDGERRTLAHGADFVTLGYSGAGRARGEVVFAGYSIARGPERYTSFPEDEDLAGRIAMVLRFEPLDEHGDSRWAPRGWSVAASLAAKIGEAFRRGAEGVILVNAPGAGDPRAQRLIDPAAGAADTTFDKPVVMMSVEQADALVRAADAEGRSLAELRLLADEGGGPVALGGATVEVEASVSSVTSDNVGAVIAGRGTLAGAWIILGAHYDHVGDGASGSLSREAGRRTHPGADDNASGTASLLLAARLLREAYRRAPADADLRSIALVAFTAEEMGLLGSAHFVANSPIPREKMYLMVNMDMVGRLRDDALEIEGANTAEGLDEWVTPYFDSSGLNIACMPRVEPNSDHASFYHAEVPILCFFTGYHDQYHRPGDVAALINRGGAVRITRLVVDLAMGLAARAEPLVFTLAEGGRRLVGRAAPDAEPEAPEELVLVIEAEPGEPEPAPEAPEEEIGAPEFPVHLGVTARPTDDGLVFVEVDEGSPAAAGGLRAGDVLVRWNRRQAPDLESWWELLATHAPGDLVEIKVRRGEREVTGYVILGRPE